LPIFVRNKNDSSDDLVVYPYGPLPALSARNERASVPCFPIIEFFRDDETDAGQNTDRYYMTLGHILRLAQTPSDTPGTCQLAKLVDRTVTVQPSSGEPYTLKNGPPYPANTLPELHLDAGSNIPGVWVEHQACQIPGTGSVPLRILPPAAHQCQ
jgi:hypothetical protein